MPNKTVIITGVNGQLGQYMVKYLHDNHPDIRVVGTQRHKSYDVQPYIFDCDKIVFELMDLSDAHSIESVIVKYKPDYFINTAANAFVGESWQVPAQHFEINCLAVLHQLEAIRKHSPHTRYFNMGTSEEFGATEKGILNEQSLLSPKSPYGASKVAARQVVKVWRESYGLYAIQGWTFNFESPLRGEKYVTRKVTKGVARIAKAIKEGKLFEPIELGNLDSVRSWQHAEDVARGIWAMLNQEIYNETMERALSEAGSLREDAVRLSIAGRLWHPKEYVLSSSGVNTIRQLVERSFAAAGIIALKTASGSQGNQQVQTRWNGDGVNETYELGGMETCVSDSGWDSSWGYWIPLIRINPKFFRPVDVTYLHGDASAIKRELGWAPKVSFDELVTRMVKSDLAAIGC